MNETPNAINHVYIKKIPAIDTHKPTSVFSFTKIPNLIQRFGITFGENSKREILTFMNIQYGLGYDYNIKQFKLLMLINYAMKTVQDGFIKRIG